MNFGKMRMFSVVRKYYITLYKNGQKSRNWENLLASEIKITTSINPQQ